ncbi:50S ribosome-binding protein YggL [Aeromonas sp. 602396]|uniref:50S ribosome-binding protein YggL n=1 Tax=Aeromonas sp. 602396 TaxID=2712042 RepID=UPI003B9F298B
MTFQPSELNKKRSRRLRKKLHLDEFQELGLHLTFTIDRAQVDFEEALDRWLDYIELQGWSFGGVAALAGGSRH